MEEFNKNQTENYEYFYVTYWSGSYFGAVCLPQKRFHAYVDNPDGFNILEGTKLLARSLNTAAIISGWERITFKRYSEFNKWFSDAARFGNMEDSKRESHLRLVSEEVDGGV